MDEKTNEITLDVCAQIVVGRQQRVGGHVVGGESRDDEEDGGGNRVEGDGRPWHEP